MNKLGWVIKQMILLKDLLILSEIITKKEEIILRNGSNLVVESVDLLLHYIIKTLKTIQKDYQIFISLVICIIGKV